MSVSDLALVFQLIRDLSSGVTVLQDFDVNGNMIYEGVSATWNADPAAGVWWITKYKLTTPPTMNKYQYSPPNQIWNNRTSIFP